MRDIITGGNIKSIADPHTLKTLNIELSFSSEKQMVVRHSRNV